MSASFISLTERAKARARLESHKLHRGNLHGLARVRIESLPGGPLGDRKRPKAYEVDLSVHLQPALDRPQHGIRRTFSRRPRGPVSEQPVHFINQFGLVHAWGFFEARD